MKIYYSPFGDGRFICIKEKRNKTGSGILENLAQRGHSRWMYPVFFSLTRCMKVSSPDGDSGRLQ